MLALDCLLQTQQGASISSSFTQIEYESISYGFTSGSIFGIFGNEPDVTTTTTFTNTFTQEQDSLVVRLSEQKPEPLTTLFPGQRATM